MIRAGDSLLLDEDQGLIKIFTGFADKRIDNVSVLKEVEGHDE